MLQDIILIIWGEKFRFYGERITYDYIMKYAEENGYKVNGLSRECYIDGIWNKDSVDEWLTEIQLPIE